MDPHDVCIATMTLARTNEEARLLEQALTRLTAHARQVVITDGGSPKAFVDRIAALPGCVVRASAYGPGLLGQVKTSLQAAAALGTSFVLYTEPDKLEFFERGLSSFLDQAPDGDDVGIVLASRSRASFETFPPFQQETETAINESCRETIGQRGDYSYGPFLLRPRLVPPVVALAEDIGWGWRPFVFGLARRLSLRVAFVEGRFDCPADQRSDDEAEQRHRLRQLDQSRHGLQLSRTAPLA